MLVFKIEQYWFVPHMKFGVFSSKEWLLTSLTISPRQETYVGEGLAARDSFVSGLPEGLSS